MEKFLSILNKLSITAFFWYLSYQGYCNGHHILSLITVCLSICFLVFLFKTYKHKPFGNKPIDCFVILMSILGFLNSEGPIYLGLVTLIAAASDLAYFLFLDGKELRNKTK